MATTGTELLSSPLNGKGRGDVRTHILDALRKRYECELEDLVRHCSAFTWNQVFLEVDRLSRTGEVRLVPRRAGVYAVQLPGPSAS